jgi:hypothetical protein
VSRVKIIIAWKKLDMTREKEKRFNITLSQSDLELVNLLKEQLNRELTMDLSTAQVIRRLLKQAVLNSNSIVEETLSLNNNQQ